MVDMVDRKGAKKKVAQRDFMDEAHLQGSKRVPLPAGRKYGTGVKDKDATPSKRGKK